MGNYFRHLFFTLRTVAFKTLFNIALIRMTSTSEQMSGLSKRLRTAEKQLKLLTHEINDIKAKMLQIQNTPTSLRHFSTSSDISETDFNPPAKRIKTNFTYEDDYVVVYTDGACENNGRVGAKAGIGVWFGDNHEFNVSAPVKGKATNNVGEIQACIKAVNIALANGVKKLCIKTDSQFVINSITTWIVKWKKNNWKLSTGGDVKNKVDFEELDKLCAKLDNVRWVHVDGHKGIKGNEEADRLARNGALQYK